MFKSKKLLGLSLGFIATISWASFYVVSRFAFGGYEDRIDPVFFSFLRFLFAGVFFMFIILFTGQRKKLSVAVKKDWKLLSLLALTGIVGEGVLVFWSLKYTTAARSSLFANTSPIFTIIIAVFAANEILNKRKCLGMLIGFAGAAFAILGNGSSDSYMTDSSVVGDLLALGSGVCWAAYTVWGARAAMRYGSLISTGAAIILGTAMLFFIVIFTNRPMLWDFPLNLWLAIIYLGVFANGIAYICWYAALKYLSPGELGAFGYISAAATIILSCIFLNEKIGLVFILSLSAIFVGVYLMMNEEKKSE